MNRMVFAMALVLAVSGVMGCGHKELAQSPAAASDGKGVIVNFETSMGNFQAELWPDKAPVTVANFLKYVDDGFYDGLIFHRVMPGFMAQGGGFTPDMKQKPTRDPIVNEASADVPNDRGTLAMARTNDLNSATSQFFINVVDNDKLNPLRYCVFGRVLGNGMTVVDKIVNVPTTTVGHYEDVPVKAVIIKSVRRAK